MAQQMGTHYAQEQVRELREQAAKAASTSVAKKLRRLADRLDRMAPEFCFQPLEGAPEMERLSHGLDELLSKLDACEETGGDPRLRTPFFGEVESILDHHKRY